MCQVDADKEGREWGCARIRGSESGGTRWCEVMFLMIGLGTWNKVGLC